MTQPFQPCIIFTSGSCKAAQARGPKECFGALTQQPPTAELSCVEHESCTSTLDPTSLQTRPRTPSRNVLPNAPHKMQRSSPKGEFSFAKSPCPNERILVNAHLLFCNKLQGLMSKISVCVSRLSSPDCNSPLLVTATLGSVTQGLESSASEFVH